MVEQHKIILAFDVGIKKYGVAVGQTLTNSARPIGIIPAKNGIANQQELDNILNKWRPNLIVVGMPVNPIIDQNQNNKNNISKQHSIIIAENFIKYLQNNYNNKYTIKTIDESFTSCEAKEKFKLLRQDNLIKRDSPLDPIAACLILERFLNKNLYK